MYTRANAIVQRDSLSCRRSKLEWDVVRPKMAGATDLLERRVAAESYNIRLARMTLSSGYFTR